MSTPHATPAQRDCPNCNYPLPPGHRALCPNCHHPLIFDDKDDRLGAIAATGLHKPTETGGVDDTVVTEPVPATPPRDTPPGQVCQACRHVNPPDQRRCERCATSLEQRPVPPPSPLAPPPPVPPRRTGWFVLLVAAALVIAVALGLFAYRLSRPPAADVAQPPAVTSPSPTLTASPSTPAELKRVKRKSIKAEASSTLPPQAPFTFAVTNTLDQDPSTAWNSNGELVGAFKRVTLTYTFAAPVQLRAIEIYNGYQRSTEAFYNNSRVRRLLVSTDATKQTFELVDRQGKQTLNFDFGQTRRVVLTVDAVYRDTPKKTKYKDCALSEVGFFRS